MKEVREFQENKREKEAKKKVSAKRTKEDGNYNLL